MHLFQALYTTEFRLSGSGLGFRAIHLFHGFHSWRGKVVRDLNHYETRTSLRYHCPTGILGKTEHKPRLCLKELCHQGCFQKGGAHVFCKQDE